MKILAKKGQNESESESGCRVKKKKGERGR